MRSQSFMVLYFLSFAIGLTFAASAPDASRFRGFLYENLSPKTRMPLSYAIWPLDYFDKLSASSQAHDRHQQQIVKECDGRSVSGERMRDYEMQSERHLVESGLNIYDGGLWAIAQTLLGDYPSAVSYFEATLSGKRGEMRLRENQPCRAHKERCVDFCGFCYGDAFMSADPDSAFFFRMTADSWAVKGSVDARCPDLRREWTWNDWKPVLGENAWASLLAPMVTAVLGAGGDPTAVSVKSAEVQLAMRMVPTLLQLRAGDSGAVYYAPHGTWSPEGPDIAGRTISVENQASLLAGLRAFRWVMLHQRRRDAPMLAAVDELILGLERFIFSSWDAERGFFRHGAILDNMAGSLSWVQSPVFAVDCQTWVGAVLGPRRIDAEFGHGASLQLWATTKRLAGYGPQVSGMVKGVGFAERSLTGDVFSGEWTLGAVNWLRVMANSGVYRKEQQKQLLREADFMRASVERELVTATPVQSGTSPQNSVLYADRRSWIPFGWWANPLPSLASTAWMVAIDQEFNPLMATGAYSSHYPEPVVTSV